MPVRSRKAGIEDNELDKGMARPTVPHQPPWEVMKSHRRV